MEKVHQLRVATRRAIAALKLYRDWLPQDEARWLSKRLKKIRRAAGDRPRSRRARRMDAQGTRRPGRRLSGPSGRRASRGPAEDHVGRRQDANVRTAFGERCTAYWPECDRDGKRQKTQDVSFHNWAETQLGTGGRELLRRVAKSEQRSFGTAPIPHPRQAIALHARVARLGIWPGPARRALSGRAEAAGVARPDQRLRCRRRAAAPLASQDRFAGRTRRLLDKLIERAARPIGRSDRRISRLVDARAIGSLRQGLAGLVGVGEPAPRGATVDEPEIRKSQRWAKSSGSPCEHAAKRYGQIDRLGQAL